MEFKRQTDNTLLGKKVKRFKLQGRNFFLTYPKCILTREELASELKKKFLTDYVIVAQETHQDGELHLHAMVTAEEKQVITRSNYFDVGEYHGNYQTCKDTDDVRNYIKKSDTNILEIGEYASNSKSATAKRANVNKRILTTDLPALVDEGFISIYSYKEIRDAKRLYELDNIKVPEYMPKTCIWIYGKTGIGKSRYVRDHFSGQFYEKPQNKWWDGYTGQKVVLLDDFDLKGDCLGHLLKIWADCYSFTAEVKGGTIRPFITHFFITSQYMPMDIFCQGKDEFKWDMELRHAIERRFKFFTIDPMGELDIVNL